MADVDDLADAVVEDQAVEQRHLARRRSTLRSALRLVIRPAGVRRAQSSPGSRSKARRLPPSSRRKSASEPRQEGLAGQRARRGDDEERRPAPRRADAASRSQRARRRGPLAPCLAVAGRHVCASPASRAPTDFGGCAGPAASTPVATDAVAAARLALAAGLHPLLAADIGLHARADEIGQLDAVVLGPDIAEPVPHIAAQHEGIGGGLSALLLVGDEG